jgi:hypothetical protein
VFLKNLADFLAEDALAGRARILIFLAILAAVLSLSGLLRAVVAFLSVVSLGIALIWVVLYVSLLISLRRRLRAFA